MAKQEPPPSLKNLESRLEAARARQQDARGTGDQNGKSAPGAGLGFGFRIAVDLLAGLAVGVGLGLLLDRWLGTTPFLLIVCFFLGAAAGMLNVYRTATRQGMAVGYSKGDDRPPDEMTPGDDETGDKG
jgi:ATP synthase protein I